MNESSGSVDEASGTLNRRRLLKGAAAAGVGVAVWTSPSITSLGGTPAYAAMCTAGFTSYELGTTNTSCNCNPNAGTPGPKVANYKPLDSTRCGTGPTFPGTFSLRKGSCGGAAVTNSGACPPGYGGTDNAGICVQPTNSSLFCRTEVRVYTGGACSTGFTQYFGAIGTGTAFLPLPGIPCQSEGNIFYSVFVRCSVERECL